MMACDASILTYGGWLRNLSDGALIVFFELTDIDICGTKCSMVNASKKGGKHMGFWSDKQLERVLKKERGQ
ncbi:MAG: hypothetical protein ACMUIL_07250 [bacterium]